MSGERLLKQSIYKAHWPLDSWCGRGMQSWSDAETDSKKNSQKTMPSTKTRKNDCNPEINGKLWPKEYIIAEALG